MSALQRQIMALSPTHYWPMDEPVGATTVRDVSGNNNHATVTSGTLANRPFLDGRPYWSGNGSSGRINAVGTAVSTTTHTLNIWSYVPTTSEKGYWFGIFDAINPTTRGIGVGCGAGATTDGGAMELAGNRVMGINEAVIWMNDTSTNWGTGWVMASITMEPTNTFRVYKNGVQALTRTTTPLFSWAQIVIGGAMGGGAANRFSGCSFAHAAWWNGVALTAPQLLNIYNTGARAGTVGG